MNGKTISDVTPSFLKPTNKEISVRDEREKKPHANAPPIRLKTEKSVSSTSSAATHDVNRLVNANSAISFLKEQHAEILKGLHQQVEELQKKCNDLQFALTMQLPYLSDEDRARISILEKSLHEKEQECNGLREELDSREHKIHKLRKELHIKEQVEKQLRRELEKNRTIIRNSNYQEPLIPRDTSATKEGKGSYDASYDTKQPVPPPKDGRLKASVRPAALYRRLLGFGVRSIKEASPPPPQSQPQSPASVDLNASIRSTTSNIPQLPRLVGSSPSPGRQRPLIRQQLRVSSLRNGDNQTLSIDQKPLTGSLLRPSDQNQRNSY